MKTLSNSTPLTPVIDGFDGYNDRVVGAENRKSGLLRGSRIQFTNTGEWLDRDTEETIGSDARYIITDLARVCVRWGKDQKPAETIVLGPGEEVPDIEAWNKQSPKSEWVDGPAGPRGPWQYQQIVYMTNPETMASSCWPVSTTGGSIAIGKIVDAIKAMRTFRPRAYPAVELSSVLMKTKYGVRPQPEFVVQGWVGGKGDDPAPAAALPAPTAPAAAPVAEPVITEVLEATPAKATKTVKAGKAKAAVKTMASKSFVLGNTVAPPSLSEELNDEIPSFGK
jgi:hypothetical protein